MTEAARDLPMRLADAVRIAFPPGGMTVAGLRRERDAGRLVVERIAGKQFVTLAAIDAMRESCRGARKAPTSTSAKGKARKRPALTIELRAFCRFLRYLRAYGPVMVRQRQKCVRWIAYRRGGFNPFRHEAIS